MNEKNLLNGLSYLSILFAPFIFPLIVWIASKDESVKKNSKKALILHIFPVLLSAVLFTIVMTTGFIINDSRITGILLLVMLVIIGLVDFGLILYTIILAVKSFVAN